MLTRPKTGGAARRAAGCGCLAAPRWRCPDCAAPWLGCSWSCLQVHQRARHPADDLDQPLIARIARQQAELNGAHGANWDSFTGHRERLTSLLCALQRGEGLCVLGGGNGDDLDLGRLAREFHAVHLVDLDGQALQRAAARLTQGRDRLQLHGGVDLSGMYGSVETWGDRADGPIGLDPAAIGKSIAGRIGGGFDVVVSSAVLSQLCVPMYRWLARRAGEWDALMGLVGLIHLHTIAALLRPGGTGVLIGDVLFGPRAPGAAAPAPPDWQSLPEEVVKRLSEGVARLRNPAVLLQLLQTAPLPDLLGDARVTDPWVWSVEGAHMLAYGVIVRRG